MSPVVKAFSNEVEATLARSALARGGVPATVHRVSRYRAMGGGGYTLTVAQSHLARAQELLEAADKPIDMDEYVDADDRSCRRCPECGSVNVTTAPLPAAGKLLTLVLAGLPLLFLKRDRQCAKCGHAWRG